MISLDGNELPVVDVHAHLGVAGGPAEDRIERLIAAMDQVGVDVACVFASVGRGDRYPEETLLIAEAVDGTGGRVVPFARVHPHWREEAVRHLEDAVAVGVRGLKLHPFMDGAFLANDEHLVHPLMRVAERAELVVLIHSGWGWNSAPGLIADLAAKFPGVTVVMGHAGRYGYHREAIVVARDLPNLYFDVAGLATPGAIEELVAGVGADRVLFGTDHPYTPLGFELEKTARWTSLSLEDIALILGGNAMRLLRLDPSVSRGHTERVVERGAAAGT